MLISSAVFRYVSTFNRTLTGVFAGMSFPDRTGDSKNGLQKPDFDDVHGDFVVTFRGTDGNSGTIDKAQSQSDTFNNITSNEVINEVINEAINETEKSVIKVIPGNGKVTKPQISEMTGLSLSTVERNTNQGRF